MKLRLLIYLLPVNFWVSAAAEVIQRHIELPDISGLSISAGPTVLIPGVDETLGFVFNDGRIVVGAGENSAWSYDGAMTWMPGPQGPDDKTAIDLGSGEILSISRTTVRNPDGSFRLPMRRSLDNWQTVQNETATVISPQVTASTGDDGGRRDGLRMHHGILELKNGNLIATLHGNFEGDHLQALGYPVEFNMLKFRTVVMFSDDRGRTWRDPITVAYDRQLARGTNDDSKIYSESVVPAVTQEGFCEADLTRAANGDLLCVMRSGGRIGVRGLPIFPTPLYCARSSDEGRTWTHPIPIADRGVNPQIVTLDNGVVVCAYARPGVWMIFSDDDGKSWKGAFQFGEGNSYCNLFKVGSNRVLAIYYRTASQFVENEGDEDVIGTFFEIERD